VEEVRKALRDEFRGLLAQPDIALKKIDADDAVAQAQFLCRSPKGQALGFAVNNSGLIVCPTVITPVESVIHLTSETKHEVEQMEQRNMLSAVKVRQPTRGLIPSYRVYPEFDELLFTYNQTGDRVELSVAAIALWAKIFGDDVTFVINDGFSAHFDSKEKLIGGPVMNESEEVMGIAVGASDSGWLVIQPWLSIENCIRMEVDAIPRTDSKTEDDEA
jgi:hypothetical protein